MRTQAPLRAPVRSLTSSSVQTDQTDPTVEWRQTGRYLWIGARDGRHVGIIEHGHGFIAIDDQGAVKGRFKTLDLARAALAGPILT